MTRAGRGAVWAGLLVALGGAEARADLFSPGELARPHANLEGSTNCTQCHPSGKGLSQERCLDCHTELKPEISQGKGYHGRISHDARECETCHHEHQGRDFALVDWGEGGLKSFPHGKTGWPLNGQHAKLTCGQCHEKRLIAESFVLSLIQKQPKRETFLGASPQCKGCHFDEHRGQLPARCDTCHTEAGWKHPARFNHDQTNYPLKGRHAKVACEKCHEGEKDTETASEVFPKPVSMSFARYASIPHRSCLDCHEDVHHGTFGPRCDNCHVVEGWRIIHNGPAERSFHEKTRFPLKGAHTTVACQACHGPYPGQAAVFKGLKFQACSDCHADAHEGQLARLASDTRAPGCDRCHTLDAFRPTTFETRDHAGTRYPLEGAHAVVACDACHAHDPKLASRIPQAVEALLERQRRQPFFSLATFTFAGPSERCETCHEDPHQGQFKKDGRPEPCAACHQVAAWKRLKFDHDKDSRFPLTGKHATTPCAACHPPSGMVSGRPDVRYKPLELACAACHSDVHLGQLAEARGERTRCERCHATSSWAAPLFVHAPPFTTYLLDGAHQKVACAACHAPIDVARGVKAARYKPLPRECEGCHADFHKGAFEGFQP